MAAGLEPAFTSGRPIWPLAGMSPADFEPDDPDLAIPRGALQPSVRDMPERLFRARHDGLITHQPTEPLAPQPAKTRDLHRKWKLALIASCFFHAAVALFFIQAADDAAKIEGAEYFGEAALGNASEEQISAGETANVDGAVEVTMITMLEAKPVEAIEAQAVPVEESAQAVEAIEPTTAEVETLQPVEETSSQAADAAPAEVVEVERAEPVEPVQAQPVQPNARAEAAAAEKVPEVLAADRVAEENDAVQRPSEATETQQAATVETVQPEQSEAEPLEPAAPEKTVRAEPEPKTAAKAEQKPAQKKAEAAEKPVEKKADRKRQEAKPKAEKGKKAAEKPSPSKRASAGNHGQNKADTRRGQANGAAGSQASSRGGKASAAGNAAVSNYPGKVAAKLRRSLRYPAEAKRKRLRGTVQVAFVVSASGGVGSVRVVSSSGSPILDKAALETVRRAAPFPRIPAAAGRSSWPFSVPLAFSR